MTAHDALPINFLRKHIPIKHRVLSGKCRAGIGKRAGERRAERLDDVFCLPHVRAHRVFQKPVDRAFHSPAHGGFPRCGNGGGRVDHHRLQPGEHGEIQPLARLVHDVSVNHGDGAGHGGDLRHVVDVEPVFLNPLFGSEDARGVRAILGEDGVDLLELGDCLGAGFSSQPVDLAKRSGQPANHLHPLHDGFTVLGIKLELVHAALEDRAGPVGCQRVGVGGFLRLLARRAGNRRGRDVFRGDVAKVLLDHAPDFRIGDSGVVGWQVGCFQPVLECGTDLLRGHAGVRHCANLGKCLVPRLGQNFLGLLTVHLPTALDVGKTRALLHHLDNALVDHVAEALDFTVEFRVGKLKVAFLASHLSERHAELAKYLLHLFKPLAHGGVDVFLPFGGWQFLRVAFDLSGRSVNCFSK